MLGATQNVLPGTQHLKVFQGHDCDGDDDDDDGDWASDGDCNNAVLVKIFRLQGSITFDHV